MTSFCCPGNRLSARLRILLLRAVISFVALILLSGCAGMWSYEDLRTKSNTLLEKRDFTALTSQIDIGRGIKYGKKNRVLKSLDLGMLHHYRGEYAKSNQYLAKAERSIESQYTKSMSKAALSMLLNDNVLPYPGEDYEDIYTNVFMALNYLHLNQFDDAFVEIRRIDMKLSLLEDKYTKLADALNTSKHKKTELKAGTAKFHNSALGRYLSLLIYEQEGKQDDARIDYDKLVSAFTDQPDIYNFNIPPVQTDSLKQVTPLLHVVSLVGTAPYKRSREYHIATAPDYVNVVSIDKDIEPVSFWWPGMDDFHYFNLHSPILLTTPLW
jgi:uncharacterized protein